MSMWMLPANRSRIFVLVILVVQNASASLLMRQSRLQGGDVKWNPLTGVVIQEVIKAVSCVALLLQEGNLQSAFADKWEFAKTTIPAVLYLIQNNLQYISVSYLDASSYAVLYQLKIITTAILSVCLLGKRLTLMQWISLVLLTAGVSAAVASQLNAEEKAVAGHDSYALGVVAVLAACVTSGLAGVSFEKLLKGSTLSLWARNLQLALFSIVVGMSSLIGSHDLSFQSFFRGYTPIVWVSLANNAFGGLLIAVVIKKADNIMKNFATSFSIILTSTVSVLMGDSSLNLLFCIGASMVIYAVFLYGLVNPLGTLLSLRRVPL